MGDCTCNCDSYTPRFNDEVTTYNPIFGPCGTQPSSSPVVIVYDGGDASGYDDES